MKRVEYLQKKDYEIVRVTSKGNFFNMLIEFHTNFENYEMSTMLKFQSLFYIL